MCFQFFMEFIVIQPVPGLVPFLNGNTVNFAISFIMHPCLVMTNTSDGSSHFFLCQIFRRAPQTIGL